MTGLLLPVAATVVGAALGLIVLAPWVRAELHAPVWRPGVRVWLALAVAACFAVVTAVVGPAWSLPALLLFAGCGAALSAVDLLERRIPNRMLVVAASVVAVAMLVAAVGLRSPVPLILAVVGAGALFLIYLVIALLAPAAMGMGDVKLAALVGGVLGFIGPAAILVGAVAIAVVGGFAALLLILIRRSAVRHGIPYGPALILGALLGALAVIAAK